MLAEIADKLLSGLLTLGAAWLGVRIEIRHLWARVNELGGDLRAERERINYHLERGHEHEPFAPPGATRRR